MNTTQQDDFKLPGSDTEHVSRGAPTSATCKTQYSPFSNPAPPPTPNTSNPIQPHPRPHHRRMQPQPAAHPPTTAPLAVHPALKPLVRRRLLPRLGLPLRRRRSARHQRKIKLLSSDTNIRIDSPTVWCDRRSDWWELGI